MWASHDDYWRPTYIEKCMALLNISPSIILACADCETIDRDTGKVVGKTVGVSTMGLGICARGQRFKVMMYEKGVAAYMLYGIIRQEWLKKCLPIKSCIAADDIFLSELSFLGEFASVGELLMVKRNNGFSKTSVNVARQLKIKNTFSVQFPDFYRELVLQRLLFVSKELNWLEKIYLSCWSWGVYVAYRMKRPYWVLRDSCFRPLKKVFMKKGGA
jgi:hypothetical protein